jgi:hypothetical protein
LFSLSLDLLWIEPRIGQVCQLLRYTEKRRNGGVVTGRHRWRRPAGDRHFERETRAAARHSQAHPVHLVCVENGETFPA